MTLYNNSYLMHYGVKGMKWGVRHDRERSDYYRDRVIKKGQNFQNVSFDGKSRDIRDGYSPIYTSHTKRDNANYTAFYSGFYGTTAIKNTMTTIKDTKVPSQQKAIEIFREMVNEDPKGFAKAMRKAKAGTTGLGHLIIPLGMVQRSKTYKKYKEAGKDFIEGEGYNTFSLLMGTNSISKYREKYFKLLEKEGYDAILDVNDVNNGVGAEEPLIWIHPSKSLANTKSVQITEKDVDDAVAEYTKLM